jgi:hypothetical protein
LINEFGRVWLQVERCTRLGLAKFGFSRITITNYLRIIYSIDWAHAQGHFSNVAKAGTQPAQLWTQKQVEYL